MNAEEITKVQATLKELGMQPALAGYNYSDYKDIISDIILNLVNMGKIDLFNENSFQQKSTNTNHVTHVLLPNGETFSFILDKEDPINGEFEYAIFDKKTSEYSEEPSCELSALQVAKALVERMENASNVIAFPGNPGKGVKSPKKELLEYIDTLSLKPEEPTIAESVVGNGITLVLCRNTDEKDYIRRYYVGKHGAHKVDNEFDFCVCCTETEFKFIYAGARFTRIEKIRAPIFPTQGDNPASYNDFCKGVAGQYLADNGTLGMINVEKNDGVLYGR